MQDTTAFERAMERLAAPINDYARASTALTLSDIGRRQHLSDVASERDYEQRSADAASARRLKEFDQMETQKLATELAKLGVDTTDDNGNTLSKDKLLGNYRTFQKTRAENILSHFDTQLELNQKAQKDLASQLQATVTKVATPMQNRQALISTLADPVASADLSQKQKKELNEILLKGGDPDQAVKKVYDYLANDYWFRKGAAGAKASAFYQKYLTEVNKSLDQSKQIDLMLYSKKFDDLDNQARDIAGQRDRHVLDFAPFLPKDSVVGKAADIGAAPVVVPPPNPNDVFHDLAKPKPAIAPPPVMSAGSGFPVARDSMELAAQNSIREQDFKKAFPRTAPPPPIVLPDDRDIRSVLGGGMSLPMGSPANLPALQPGEDQKLRQAALEMGISQDDFDKGDQRLRAIQAGDPVQPQDQNLISTFNLLLRKIRGGPAVSGIPAPSAAAAPSY